MSAATLEVRDVSVALGRRPVVVDASLTVAHGELAVIVGPNGAGKTTLLRAVAGLLPYTGTVTIGGSAMAPLAPMERARKVAYLPQGHVFHWPIPVGDAVALGRLPHGGGRIAEADAGPIRQAMADTDTLGFAKRPVTALSGGERARVAVARVLATEAPIILADEPTASLDPRYQLAILELLRRHARSYGAVVAVLHDLSLAARVADRVVMMEAGRIVANGPPREVLTASRLVRTFGVTAEVVEVAGAPAIVPVAISAAPPTPDRAG